MADCRITNADGQHFNVLVLRGSQSVQRFTERLAVNTRPGVDGADYQKIGQRATPFRIRTFVDATSASEARQVEIAYNAMAATLIKYRDPDGATWDDVMVLNVRCTRRLTPGGTGFQKSPGYSEYGVFADWTLVLSAEPTTEPP